MLPRQWGMGPRGDTVAGTGGHRQDTKAPNQDS
jgi:hypothetical protein